MAWLPLSPAMLPRLLASALVLGLAAPSFAQTVSIDSVAVGGGGMGGRGAGPYTLFSLSQNRVVPNADSASTSWDLGFRGTTVIVNGGTSGPGEGAAALVETSFEDVDGAVALVADGDGDCPRGEPLAVCTGSGNGWYLYAENGVVPLPGRSLVVRLADGSGLAKVRFVSYTLSEPRPDGSRPRYYALDHERLAGE